MSRATYAPTLRAQLRSAGLPSSSGSSRAARPAVAIARGGASTSSSSLSFAAAAAADAAAPLAGARFADFRATTAFLFPGQGAQHVGMARETAAGVPAARELFDRAGEILGYDLLAACTEGPADLLNSTAVSQPAIYVCSLAAVEALRAREGGQAVIDSCDAAAGLSLGEYTALAFAGAIGFEDGLRIVKARGESMQAASDAAPSAMASVIGLDAAGAEALCEEVCSAVGEPGCVRVANYLCKGNYAVSGSLAGIEALEGRAKGFGAKMVVRLAVAGAFHTGFMGPAVPRLEAVLAETAISEPRIPVVSNVDALPHGDPARIREVLGRQVTSSVLWEDSVRLLLSRGVTQSYELGPGKVIAGIMRRIDRKASVESVECV